MEHLPREHTILERPFMLYRPFGVDEQGDRIQDFSGMVIRDNVEFLEECVKRTRGEAAAAKITEELCSLLNARIRDSAYHVTPEFLRTVWNSYSYEFASYLREFARQLSGNPTYHHDVGKEKHISPLIQTLGRPFSLAQIHRMYPYFAQKFARGLECTVVDVTGISAVLRLKYPERIAAQFGPYLKACAAQTCESSKGRIAMVPVRLHGLTASTVVDRACIVRGDPYCEWEVRWKDAPRRQKLWLLGVTAVGLSVFAYLRMAHPDFGVVESLVIALVPSLASGLAAHWRIEHQTRKREALIHEQVSFVEARHEELREAYLEQEQTRVQLRRKVNHLTVLHRAGLMFSSTLDRETLLQQVLETLTRDLHYDRAMLSFYDPLRQTTKDVRLVGVSPEISAFARSKEAVITDPESPEGQVLIQGKPILIGDLRAMMPNMHPLNQELARMTGTKSFIAVPLRSQDKILGSLMVDRMQEHALTVEDLELMVTFAHQVAIALDNASAYQQIEELNVGLEAKVQERTAELEQADRLRSQFLSHVSHELKTPLTSIKGFVQNMLDGLTGPVNEKQQRYLTRLLENAERLIRMIEDLLDRTRIQTGRLELGPTELDLCECVADAIEQLRPLAQAKRQQLDTFLPPGTLMVWADRDRLFQIITNLVQNAVKFTPEGGRVVVAVEQDGLRSSRLSVRDNGPGIPVESIDKIFDPFFRVKQARTGTKGLGLGLSIVRTLVELHGGTIAAKSVPGQGAEFVVTLPLRIAVELPLRDGPAGNAWVLVADDDPDIRQMLGDRLRARGYHVRMETDGRAALEAARSQAFAGLILDIGIPSLDGMEVLRQIRERDQQMPIIMITASGAKEAAIRAIGMGAQAYLLKPFEGEEFQQAVDAWFRTPVEKG